MGAKKKSGTTGKKVTPEKVADVVAGLAEKDARVLDRVRHVAEALELDKVIGALEVSEDVLVAIRQLLRRGGNRYTLAEAAGKAGFTADEFAQLNLACGFSDPGPDARVFTDEDVQVLWMFQASKQFFGEDVAMQNVRVMGSAMARVADAFMSSFATTIGRQSTERELTDEDWTQANESAVQLLPFAVQAMDVLLRRHLELKSRGEGDFRMGAEWEGVDAIDRAVGFCDLVGYTALSEQTSTSELSALLRTFETTASDLITVSGASVVKLIGDEVMFVAPDASTAIDAALRLAESFEQDDGVPPVRCGLSAGRVILQEGDYHGPVVNLAARIVKLAPPSNVFAPRSIVGELRNDIRTEDVGSRRLKGFEEPIELVRLYR